MLMSKLNNMKFLTTFIVVLCSFHFNGAGRVSRFNRTVQHTTESTSTVTPNTSLNEIKSEIYTIQNAASTSSVITSTPLLTTEQDLENTSIQDLLLSGKASSEKIEENIISEKQNFLFKLSNYREHIALDTKDYVFPQKQIKYELDNKGYLTFYNISLSRWKEDNTYSSFSELYYSLNCDPSKTPKMSVGLPTNLQISANFSLTSSLTESPNEGEISIVIKNGTISKYDVNSKNFDDQFPKISYSNFEVDIRFDAGPRWLIYNKLEAFFDEMELSFRQFFAQQFNIQMRKNGLSLSSDCSSISHNDFHALNNLYVIQGAKIEACKGITLNVGPIVMEGFSLNTTELHILKNQDAYYGPNYNMKKLTLRSRAGPLRGKFEWNYIPNDDIEDNSSFVYFFSIDGMQFETSYSYPSISSSEIHGLKQNLNVYLGKIEIKPFVSNSENNEVKFSRLVLTEYLKSAITKSLEKTFADKTDGNQINYVENFFTTSSRRYSYN